MGTFAGVKLLGKWLLVVNAGIVMWAIVQALLLRG
jgi:hypothetical protein